MAENTNPHFFDLVGNVRAMRRLKPDPVPMELIWKVLNAGVQAPSGQNTQPWRFVLVSEPTRKKWFADRYKRAIEKRSMSARDESSRKKNPGRQLKALYHQMDHLHEVPYLLFVCGKCDWPFKVPEHERVGEGPPNYGAVLSMRTEHPVGVPSFGTWCCVNDHAPGVRGRAALLF
jgi:hypothetical protein